MGMEKSAVPDVGEKASEAACSFPKVAAVYSAVFSEILFRACTQNLLLLFFQLHKCLQAYFEMDDLKKWTSPSLHIPLSLKLDTFQIKLGHSPM